jgi:hypothetical protein
MRRPSPVSAFWPYQREGSSFSSRPITASGDFSGRRPSLSGPVETGASSVSELSTEVLS